VKFKSDYAVYVCPHVFLGESDVLDVVRDPDGYWQFFCGEPECSKTSKPKLIGVGHLLNKDETINEVAKLEVGSYAERASASVDWKFGIL